MNDLEKFFRNNEGHLIDKWMHYFEIYDRHLSKFRGQEVNVLEFGVYQGGSLKMWKEYFGPKAKIYGVDINPDCKVFDEDRISIFIGDQENRSFLKNLTIELPRIDIVIEDGGHTMGQQITTFEEIFPHMSENGVYLCEDLHTSYWSDYGGGYKKSGTFIEYSKNLIDCLSAWHSREELFQVDEFTRTANSISYYDSVIVIEKRKMSVPLRQKTGVSTIAEWFPTQPAKKTRFQRLKELVGIAASIS